MKKLTRKTFSRKFVAIGLSAFMGVGLISTGFAAWIMSSNASAQKESNVTVATLSDVSMSFQNVDIQNDKSIVFGAAEGDRSGRLTGNGEEDECLSIVVTGTITNAYELGKLEAKLELPSSIQQAVTQGYLIAPDSANKTLNVYTAATESQAETRHNDLAITFSGENNSTATFSYTVKFAWGEKFNNMNPSLYYDEDPIGKEVSNEDMAEEMKVFRALLANSAPQDEIKHFSYTLTLTAISKSSV